VKRLGFLRVFAHPSVLPLAISTFISIAGPGGVAEISLHAPVVANLPTTFDAPLVVAPPSEPMVLVLHRVPAHTPSDVPDQPIAPLLDPQLPGDQSEPATQTSPVTPEALETQIPEPAPAASPDHAEGAVPEVPAAPPTDTGDEPAPPPADEPDGDAGDETGNDEGADTGEPDGDGDGNDDGAGDDEPVCDPPGTGPEPHDGVPPGHDKNDDGTDDRCQEDGEESDQDSCHSNGNSNGNGNGHDQDGDGVRPLR